MKYLIQICDDISNQVVALEYRVEWLIEIENTLTTQDRVVFVPRFFSRLARTLFVKIPLTLKVGHSFWSLVDLVWINKGE